MTVTTVRLAEPPAWLGTLFDRIVCGVDGTESSRVAVAQAVRLLGARRIVELVSVVEGSPVPWSGRVASADLERQYEEAQRALREARAQYPRPGRCFSSATQAPRLSRLRGMPRRHWP